MNFFCVFALLGYQKQKYRKEIWWYVKKNVYLCIVVWRIHKRCPTDRIADTNMQNEQHNTLTQREKYPPLSHCSSVSYSVLLQCNTSPAAHGQPRAGGAFLLLRKRLARAIYFSDANIFNQLYV